MKEMDIWVRIHPKNKSKLSIIGPSIAPLKGLKLSRNTPT